METVHIKSKNRYGFSLAETLMAVLILLLVSSVIAAGIPAAVNAYTKAVDGANAHALLSTTVNALRSELSLADVQLSSDKKSIIYISPRTEARTRMYIGPTDNLGINTIMIQDFLQSNSETVPIDGAGKHSLISEAAITENLNVFWDTASPLDLDTDKNVLTIKNIVVTINQNKVTNPVDISINVSAQN